MTDQPLPLDGLPPEPHLTPVPWETARQERWDRAEGQRRKAEGQAQALSPEDLEPWKDRFRAEVRRLAQAGPAPFTSEDVVDAVGLPSGDVGQHANNAVGAMMGAMAKAGVIRRKGYTTSRRPVSHGAVLSEWQGVAW